MTEKAVNPAFDLLSKHSDKQQNSDEVNYNGVQKTRRIQPKK